MCDANNPVLFPNPCLPPVLVSFNISNTNWFSSSGRKLAVKEKRELRRELFNMFVRTVSVDQSAGRLEKLLKQVP